MNKHKDGEANTHLTDQTKNEAITRDGNEYNLLEMVT